MSGEPWIIRTGKDGVLADGGKDGLDRLSAELATHPKVVVHFHGGLVDAASGLSTAFRLNATYRSAGAEPIFFVWESGLLEILRHNITEIAGEDIFKILLKYVTKFTWGKVQEAAGVGGRGSELQLPNDMVYYTELARRDRDEEPYVELTPTRPIEELTEDQQRAFEETLEQDDDFQETVRAIQASVLPAPESLVSRGIEIRTRAASRTLLSPEIFTAIEAEGAQVPAGSRGLIGSVVLIRKAAQVLARVVSRLRQQRDHGFYPTVVEEILREFYLANAGASLWAAMKRETSDTFIGTGMARGGWYFAEQLSQLAKTGYRPRITLVGHSTGAVFILNLLKHLQAQRMAGGLPVDFTIENIVLLAPACTIDTLSEYVQAPYFSNGAGGLCRHLRVFAMQDATESQDKLVPFVYPRSLLYFVSGVLERDHENRSLPDAPIAGMERFYTRDSVYTEPAIATVRAFLRSESRRAVWSPVDGSGPGLSSRSLRHGDFDNDETTLGSLVQLIRDGD